MLSSTSLLRLWACSRLRLHGGAKPAIRQQCFSEPISVYALPTLPRHHARQDGGDAEHFSENPSAVFAKVSSSDFGEELVVFYHLSSKCISAFADGNTYGRFAGRGKVSYLYLREASFCAVAIWRVDLEGRKLHRFDQGRIEKVDSRVVGWTRPTGGKIEREG